MSHSARNEFSLTVTGRMSVPVTRRATAESMESAKRRAGTFGTSAGSAHGVIIASFCGSTPFASTLSRMHRPSTTTRSARRRQNRSRRSNTQCTIEPRLMTPAASGTSGYRSIVQKTNRVPFIQRRKMPTSAMNGGVVRQMTTS